MALTRSVDLVLLDISMPMLDGRDVLNHLKKDPRTAHIPVLVCSGRIDLHNRRVALELGAVDFFEKPFNPKALMLKIRHLIEHAKAGPAPTPEQKALRSGHISEEATGLRGHRHRAQGGGLPPGAPGACRPPGGR